jgi:UDP-N-acetylglucosamine 4,6-dehydratase
MKQLQMSERFQSPDTLRFFIGDVRDLDRLELAMRDVDIVIHAAALKQVPAAEYNPIECIKTNVYGAENVVKASLRTNVQKVIGLSTDKAASPLNLYGASKLAADKIFVAANNLSAGHGPKFSVVRYGNVLGSRGSVVPLFSRMIESGIERLPITDERMTRFWITLRQGTHFVLSSLEMMHGGEIFVPKIPSMRIVDLARTMKSDISFEQIGIRPGEKLHEVMITEDDARSTIDLGDRYVILPIIVFGPQHTEHMHTMFKGARPVDEGFRYASDNNDEWLESAQMLQLLADTKASDTH